MSEKKFFVNSLLARVFFIFIFPFSLWAQNNLPEVFLMDVFSYPSIEFFSTDVKDFYHPDEKAYPSTALFDGDFKTCWVAGSSESDDAEILYIKLPSEIPSDQIILNIFSGYGKSRSLHKKNARPRQIEVSAFSAFHLQGSETEVAIPYFLLETSFRRPIFLKDKFGVQSFPLDLRINPSIRQFKNKISKNTINGMKIKSAIVLKLKIKSTYKGTKYSDICISEIFFNDRLITPTPTTKKIQSLYIKDQNTLVIDYPNQKSIVVYKDPNFIYTGVDWNKGNFALLHLLPKKTAPHSRVEEIYSLIDLKNKRKADQELKIRTGASPMFRHLEKDESGRIFLNADPFRIELK